MPLPLFDDVVVSVPERDGPVRIHEGKSPTAAHTSARLSPAPIAFSLDGDYRDLAHRPPPVRPGHPCYAAYWSAFRKGQQNQTAPPAEPDPMLTSYLKAGYRLGQLARPLPCMTERR